MFDHSSITVGGKVVFQLANTHETLLVSIFINSLATEALMACGWSVVESVEADLTIQITIVSLSAPIRPTLAQNQTRSPN